MIVLMGDRAQWKEVVADAAEAVMARVRQMLGQPDEEVEVAVGEQIRLALGKMVAVPKGAKAIPRPLTQPEWV